MENLIYLIIALIAAGGIAVAVWNNRRTAEPEEGNASDSVKPDEQKPMTCELLQEVLRKMGCTCHDKETEKGWKRIFFPYQGENFIAETWRDGAYVHLWNTFWTGVSLDDIDEVSRLRRAINDANIRCSVTIFYTIDEENNKMAVHFKYVMPFNRSMANLEDYLRVELGSFFKAQRALEEELRSVRDEENRNS